MKQVNYLKWLRTTLALLIFIPILLVFIDIRKQQPVWLTEFLAIQLFPAILAGAIAILVFQFVLVLLFGRVYCSVICPAGILQDIINRIYCIGKKKKKGARRFKFSKPQNLLRYGLMGLTFLLLFLGVLELGLVLDPYSNFGRIATNLIQPIAVGLNNIVAAILEKFDNYTFYYIKLSTVTAVGVIAGAIALIVFVVMVALRGRLFCNTLCPVGALLSLVSRYSLFRVNINKDKCISCGLCEKSCKAEAINTKDFSVDASRCVSCFNCISSCKKDSIHYSIRPPFRKTAEAKAIVPMRKDEMTASVPADNSRRSFLATGATVAATLPIITVVAQATGNGSNTDRLNPITPPGSLNLERFKDKCTGCHLCVVQCPSQLLRPAGLQFGLGYMLKPHMSYLDSYCNYECKVCADVCPSDAIRPITVEEKVTTQVGIAEFYLDRCIVETENTDCGACSEHCPTQAVHMELYKEGSTLTVPVVEPDLCIGCGGCESICPVRPDRAIIIKANRVHQVVEKPAEEEVIDFEIDGFGF